MTQRGGQESRRPTGRLLCRLATVAVVGGALLAVAGLPARPARAASPVGAHVYQGGGVIGFGDAETVAPPSVAPLSSVVVAMAADPTSTAVAQGYWLAAADGGVFAQGRAPFFGSLGALHLQGPIVAIAATADGGGYWLGALDGGVFAFGDAAFDGSMGAVRLNQPVVGMAATPDGKGYWLVASDGGIFAFGDAAFLGSMGAVPLNAPIVGMAATSDGKGYWLVASDGGIFAFGDAAFFGSMGGQSLDNPITGMASTPDGRGYLMVASDGGVFPFGSAPLFGSLGGGYLGNPFDVPPVAGITLTPDDKGYWLLEPDGWSYSFTAPGDAPPPSMVPIADSQVASDATPGNFCNPYGPCEEWCALFATWVWEQAGVPIPSYAFTGSIYYWAAANSAVLPPGAAPAPGDAVLYGTGPWSTATSLHVGIVAETWPDGAIVTIEGDAGPAPNGSLAVIINGPYLPSRSAVYNGMPIYAFAVP